VDAGDELKNLSKRSERLKQKYKRKLQDPGTEINQVSSGTFLLNVNGFVNEVSGFQKIGSSPWLDADDGTNNYIRCYPPPLGNMQDRYYTFEDLSVQLISLTSVKLKLVVRSEPGIYSFALHVYVWDGAYQQADYFTIGQETWHTVEADVTSILDSEDKINNTRLRLVTDGSNNDRGEITHAYLEVIGTFGSA